jgi:hypothetical protein
VNMMVSIAYLVNQLMVIHSCMMELLVSKWENVLILGYLLVNTLMMHWVFSLNCMDCSLLLTADFEKELDSACLRMP